MMMTINRSAMQGKEHVKLMSNGGRTCVIIIGAIIYSIAPSHGTVREMTKAAFMTRTINRRAMQVKEPVKLKSNGGRNGVIRIVTIIHRVTLSYGTALEMTKAAIMTVTINCRAMQAKEPGKLRGNGRRTGDIVIEIIIYRVTPSYGTAREAIMTVTMTMTINRRAVQVKERVKPKTRDAARVGPPGLCSKDGEAMSSEAKVGNYICISVATSPRLEGSSYVSWRQRDRGRADVDLQDKGRRMRKAAPH